MYAVRSCQICHSSRFSAAEADYERCDQCGTVYRTEICSPAALQEQTDAHLYRRDPLCIPPSSTYPGFEIERDLLTECECKGSALDIGAGNGNFLALLRHMGFDGTGIEPNAPRAAVIREAGFRVLENRFDRETMAVFKSAKFDLISLRDSICYLDNLDEALALCTEYLKPNGMLYVRILVSDSPYFRFKIGTIAKRVSVACTVLMSKGALETFLRSKGFEIIGKREVPYSAKEILESWRIPSAIYRWLAPLFDRYALPHFAPDHVLLVAKQIS